MSIFETLKADKMEAKKMKSFFVVGTLNTLIGEIETETKRANKEADDEMVIKTITKFIKNINETLKVKDVPNLVTQREILNGYLPEKLSIEELEKAINSIIVNGASNIGQVMGQLKVLYKSSQYDGKLASTRAKELLHDHNI